MPNLKRKTIRILVVDDLILNQEIARDFIEDLGFCIDVADDGLQALEAVKRKSYSLICMDVQMPVMDGVAATKAIREYETVNELKHVPIIALTADCTDGIKERCFDAGMNDFQQKPFSQQELYQKMAEWLNDELLSISHSSSDISQASTENIENPLLDEVEAIAQVSHWFWYFSDQRIQFSKYLQHHFVFPLDDIKTLDDYMSRVGSDNMNAVVSECITTRTETRWEQKIIDPDTQQPKYLLHRFRVVISEDDSPILIGTIQDITFIRNAEEQIIELASYDVVTGLSSRFRFDQQLDDLIKYAHRHSQKFALLYLKLGALNEVNDNDEHDVCDKILVEFTNRFRSILRKSDYACRLIDDEFCLAIRDITDDLVAMRIAERYLKELETPITIEDKRITPHISIGLAIYPQDGVKTSAITSAAKTAMKRAESTGKNSVAFYENALTDAAQQRMVKEKELRAAFTKNQFELYYQPKISLESGEVESVEASIRWNHPDTNLYLPEDFLPDAERMNIMVDIGHWMLREACNQIKAWREQGLDLVPVAVNVSQQHFEQSGFADSVFMIVNDAGIPPSLIEIEINESISRDQKLFRDTCDQLAALGFKTALDDFGTGFSSLSTLKDIPIDVLKIDREFVRNLPNDDQSSIMIGTILGISNALGLQLVAKGVETDDQLKTLIGIGCHLAQGAYFSPPVPATEIPAVRKQNFCKPNIHRVA